MILLSNKDAKELTSEPTLDLDRASRKTFWFKQPKKKNGVEVPSSFKAEFLNMMIRCGKSTPNPLRLFSEAAHS